MQRTFRMHKFFSALGNIFKPQDRNLSGEMLEKLLYKEEVSGEKLINRMCLFVSVFILLLLIVVTVFGYSSTRHANYLVNFTALFTFATYHLVLFIFLKKNIYKWYFKYITVFLNVGLVTIALVGYSIVSGFVHALRTAVIVGYYVVIALSGCYQKTRMPLITACVAFVHYMAIYCYGYFFADLKTASSETFNTPVVSYDVVVTITSGFFFTGAIVGYITGRLRRVLHRSLVSRAEAIAHEREKLEIKEMSEIKTNFFVNLAHETKTPLTLIGNYLAQYISKVGETDELRIVMQNVNKLRRDMTNFLDSQKLERGQFFYNHDDVVNISELLNQKLPLFMDYAAGKAITLTGNVKSGIFIKMDPAAVDRIINNVIENAIKYTSSGGTVLVDLDGDDDIVIFTVEDNGIGISLQQQEHIFKPYHQLSTKKRNIQGIGMGLNIVKMIVDSVNGRIELFSVKGQGTTFKILLNRSTGAGSNNTLKEAISAAPVDYITRDRELIEKVPDAFKNNILLVEDNRDLLAFLKTNLENDYNVYFAFNGRDALTKLHIIGKPDIIISDIMMDVMDGGAFFKELSRDDYYADVPFIFLTAKSTPEDKIKGLEEGAIDYIYKPFSMEELRAKIKAILHNHKLKKAFFENDKYTTLGTLLGGICYELLQPLRMIYDPLDLLNTEMEKCGTINETAGRYLMQIAKNLDQMEKIIESTMNFTDEPDINKQNIDIEKIVESLKDIFHNKIKDKIHLEYNIDPCVLIVTDEEIIGHILINLISYAVDILGDTGRIVVSTSKTHEGTFIMVKNIGNGIANEDSPFVFNAFYTNRGPGHGSELDLYMVKELVGKLGWDITVSSIPGVSTEFVIKVEE